MCPEKKRERNARVNIPSEESIAKSDLCQEVDVTFFDVPLARVHFPDDFGSGNNHGRVTNGGIAHPDGQVSDPGKRGRFAKFCDRFQR